MKKEVICFLALEWCRSSRKMSYVFENVSHTNLSNKFQFTHLDVETHKGVDMSCKYDVKNVPTTIILKDGKEIGRIKGYRDEKELTEELKKYERR